MLFGTSPEEGNFRVLSQPATHSLARADESTGGSLSSNLKERADDARDRAFHAWATGYIFEKRAQALRKKLQLVSFLGLVVPLVVGGLALSYGVGFSALPVIIIVGSAIGIAQAVVALWSLVATWVEAYDHAVRSAVNNKALTREFEGVARALTIHDSAAAEIELRTLEARDDAQRDLDTRAGVTEPQKREGMRSALLRTQRKCVRCEKIPESMQPTECGVCGDYNNWLSGWR
ncbi:mobilome CxxCx(11)CxxC protein [Actinomycetospora flava]|uniref:mobilome CxxCx(11)CxxC protein n=1 Tax=Actinomycetospora flava TaxID=3129232 RepID=UPI00359F2580